MSRLRSLAGLTVAATLLLGVSPAAAQQDDLDCESFLLQAEAQAWLEADRSDPDGLDADLDGLACGEFSYETVSSELAAAGGAVAETQLVGTQTPAGVDTGGGLQLTLGALAVGLAGLGAELTRRRRVA